MAELSAEVSYFQADFAYRKSIGESQSQLKSILISPAHYQAATRRFLKPSSAMIIGTATHCKVLEGNEKFEADFVKKPSNIKYTNKEGRQWKDEQKGKTVLSNDGYHREWDSVIGMSQSLSKLDWFNPSQSDYRKYNEVSIYWVENDIHCKARLDRVIVTDDEVHVIDLKTTDSVSTDKFQSKLVDLGYDFQAGWYTHAAAIAFGKPATFTFVAVERQEPWSVKVFDVPDEMLHEARKKNEKALRILKSCKKANSWPKQEITRQTLQYPRWYTMTTEPARMDLSNMTADDFAGIL